MGLPQSPTPPHLYPQALQLKLYQAFIFSIPILFSIILFLLFYLFYLKRRASTLSSPPQILPRSSNIQATSYVSSVCQIGLKEELKDNLPIVLFDEELRTRDSQCCVCLGEFEIKEELLQIPACKHVFHIDCIHHWLHSNSTCPLCRCFVLFPITKLVNPVQPSGTVPPQQDSAISHQNLHIVSSSSSSEEEDVIASSREQLMVSIEGSSLSVTSYIIDSANLPDHQSSISIENGRGSSNQESVILHIQTHST